MPLPNILKPLFPNVPNLPGVPSLPRSPNFPPSVQAVLGLVQGVIWQALTAAPVWGIFTSGSKTSQSFLDKLRSAVPQIGIAGFVINPRPDAPGLIAQADSVFDFGYRNESKISSFPVQAGSFANYNKVNDPYEVMVRMTKGGSKADRAKFLNAIDAAANSLDLYDVVTPEKTYTNANISKYEYRREARNGAYLMIVDITLIEIRQVTPQVSTAVTKNAKNVSGVSPTAVGKVQPAPLPPSLLSQISTKAKTLLK